VDLGRRGTLRLLSAAALSGLVAAVPADADQGANTLTVTDAWARPTPPALQAGAAYLSIQNRGTAADRLLSAESLIASSIEFHETSEREGVMQMRQVAFVDCPPGAVVKASPGGLHIMLLGLKQPLQAGSAFFLTLKFRDAGLLTVKVSVEARG
jgi:periplasmic copper chaperone A